MRSLVTMAVSLWQGNTITLQPDMDPSLTQVAHITSDVMASLKGK